MIFYLFSKPYVSYKFKFGVFDGKRLVNWALNVGFYETKPKKNTKMSNFSVLLQKCVLKFSFFCFRTYFAFCPLNRSLNLIHTRTHAHQSDRAWWTILHISNWVYALLCAGWKPDYFIRFRNACEFRKFITDFSFYFSTKITIWFCCAFIFI